jgi:hypothetical protein
MPPNTYLAFYCGGDSCACVLCVCLADGVWLLLAKLTAPDGALHEKLGVSVSMAGDGTRVAAGVNEYGSMSGSVYIFAEGGVYICVTASIASIQHNIRPLHHYIDSCLSVLSA